MPEPVLPSPHAAGIHFRFDITAGSDMGRAAAQLAIALDSQPGLLAARH